MVNIGKRLRRIRMAKNMSQTDVRKATGLFACYVSRIENGFAMPSLQTLELLARGFQIPFHEFLYQLTCPKFGNTPDESEYEAEVDERRRDGGRFDGGKPAIDIAEQTPSQTDPQMAGQNSEMLATDNNVQDELSC